MQYEVVIKNGTKEIARATGIEREPEFITVADTLKIIEIEQTLEKLTGLRFHISQIG